MLKDEKGLKELVQRVRWIGQAEMQEGIGYQKMAKFVINTGDGHRKARQEQEPEQYDESREKPNAWHGAWREAFGLGTQQRNPEENAGEQQNGEGEEKPVVHAEAEGIFERRKETEKTGKHETEDPYSLVAPLHIFAAGSIAGR